MRGGRGRGRPRNLDRDDEFLHVGRGQAHNASIVRRGLEFGPNDFNVDSPIRLQTGDQFWSSLLTWTLVGLRHRIIAVCRFSFISALFALQCGTLSRRVP